MSTLEKMISHGLLSRKLIPSNSGHIILFNEYSRWFRHLTYLLKTLVTSSCNYMFNSRNYAHQFSSFWTHIFNLLEIVFFILRQFGVPTDGDASILRMQNMQPWFGDTKIDRFHRHVHRRRITYIMKCACDPQRNEISHKMRLKFEATLTLSGISFSNFDYTDEEDLH